MRFFLFTIFEQIHFLFKKYKNIISLLNKPEKKRFSLLIILNFLISVADVLSLALMLVVINFYTAGKTNALLFISNIFNAGNNALPALLFLIFFSLKNISGYFVLQMQYNYVFTVAARLSKQNLFYYLEGEYLNYVSIDSAYLVKKINQHPIEYAQYVLFSLQQIFSELMLILFSVTAILIYNAKLFLLLFFILIPAVVIMGYFIKQRLKDVRNGIKQTGEKSLQYLQEALNGFVESNVYQKNIFFTERYATYQGYVNNYLSKMQSTQGISSRLIEVFAMIGIFTLLLITNNSNNTDAAFITIGAFIAAAYKIIPGIVRIINFAGQIKTYSYTINDLKNETVVKKSVLPEKLQNIIFENVSFNYDDKKIIQAIDISLQPGSFIILAGNSGKGKTTIINLLLGFLSPSGGNIFFNNKITTAEERKNSWLHIAYIKQQGFFIDGTILENIVFDKNDLHHEKLLDAVDKSGLKKFIDDSSLGIESIITENGKNISGGQRQRIAMARALYKNASLFILDEPFSELDEKSEGDLLHNLKELASHGKTVLLVTHNQKAFFYADKIYSLNE